MSNAPLYIVVTVVGYLLGSIPSGQIVAWLYGGVDLSTLGSGKTGTTNVLRTLGPGAAAVVLAGDVAKGIAAVLVARWLVHPIDERHVAEALAGFAAVLGHNWSIYIKLKGGRGVVVSQAVFLLFCWPAAVISLASFVVILAVSRFVSLASLSGAVIGLALLAAFVFWGHYPPVYLAYGVPAAALIWLRHIDNIQRLLAGTERRIGQQA